MNYFQDFENGLDGWRFTQSDGKIVEEKDGNHYITGDEYVEVYSLGKIFKLPFADNLPVRIKFKIKVPKDVTLTILNCILNAAGENLNVPESDDQWHSYEVKFPPPPPQTSGFPKVSLFAHQEIDSPPYGVGFDDIEIIQ